MNPFKTQMDKIKTQSTNNTVNNEDNTSTVSTQSSELFNRRRKDNKQIYSVKLQRELSDKLITLSLSENISFTDIIEFGLEKVFDELDVRIDKDLVRKYNLQKSKKNK